MDNIRSDLIPHIKNFSKLIQRFYVFKENKEYKQKNYLDKLTKDVNIICKTSYDNKKSYDMLIAFKKNENNLSKLFSAKNIFYKSIDDTFEMKGGFFSNDEDNKFTKTLNLVDFMLDLIRFIPNNILTSSHLYIGLPYSILSILLNLFRNDYDFAYYSFLGVIPGVGGLISSSIKMVHRIIRYITNKNIVKSHKKYYKQIQASRRVHRFIKDDNYENIKNPYLNNNENQYNIKDIENLYKI